jgi:hypothetical protein
MNAVPWWGWLLIAIAAAWFLVFLFVATLNIIVGREIWKRWKDSDF